MNKSHNYHIVLSCAVFMCVFSTTSNAHAEQVTMAAHDITGNGIKEIIRTEEEQNNTIIRIYKKIENSSFYMPDCIFNVLGRLVQVPECYDVDGNGIDDYVFATGIDMGIIYFDETIKDFKRATQDSLLEEQSHAQTESMPIDYEDGGPSVPPHNKLNDVQRDDSISESSMPDTEDIERDASVM